MAKKKKKSDNLVLIMTPAVPTGFNHLNKPDQYKDPKTGKKGPLQYTSQLIMKPEELDMIKDDIDAVVEDAYEKATGEIEEKLKGTKRKKALDKLDRHYPYTENEDSEGEPDGNFLVKTKSAPKTKGKKVARRFGVFDAKGNRTDVLVYGGSIVKMQLYVKGFYNPATQTVGATLYIQAVQVIELAGDAGGGGNPFGEEEGFVDDGDDDFEDLDDGDDEDDDEEDEDDDF